VNRRTRPPNRRASVLFDFESIEISVNLPTPPSVNRLWCSGRGRVFRSKAYLDWIRAADAELMASRQMPKRRIEGPFAAHITLSRKVRGDVDNRVKGLLDFYSPAKSSETTATASRSPPNGVRPSAAAASRCANGDE
jgi:hypothetical protein